MRVLLVPSLRVEGWKAMDRYADALAQYLPWAVPSGCSVTRLPDPGYPAWARFPGRWLAYPRTLDWSRWDVVHVLDHSYAHVLHRRRGHARTVLTVHDLFACEPRARQPGLRGAAVRRINAWVLAGMRRADVCLCDSQATLSALRQHAPDVAARARHQMLGVDQRFFVPNLSESRHDGRTRLGLPSDAIVVLHVGSCVPRKNLPALLNAIAGLASSLPSLCLVQVGGRWSADQRALIDRLGIAPRVFQHFHVPEAGLPAVYAAADVAIVPSLFEGFGLPLLEAFAVGVPVVATRNTALADFPDTMLQSAGDGSAKQVEAALQAALGDQSAARVRADLAREWARKQTWARIARATARVYMDVL